MNLPVNQFIRASQVIALLMFAVMPATAQPADEVTDGAAEPEPPQYYQVELIVFRHLDQASTTAEIPRMPVPEMTAFLEQDLARLAGQEPLPQTMSPPVAEVIEAPGEPDLAEVEEQPGTWIPVDPEGLLLTGMVSAIDRVPAYELVSYLNWAQTAADVTIAEALDLQEIGADEALLTGTVELHERRYLHLTVEVTLTDPDAAPDSSLLGVFDGPLALPAVKGSRRIRLEKVQYFDQPQFGVIAVVSRLKLPEEARKEAQEEL